MLKKKKKSESRVFATFIVRHVCCPICSSVEVKGHDEEGKGGQAGDEPEEEAMKKKKTQLKLHLVCKFLAFAESLCLTFSEYLRFTRRPDAAPVSAGCLPPCTLGKLPSNKPAQ